jgi:hypothetical protein
MVLRLIQSKTAGCLVKADHAPGAHQIQHSAYMRGLALVGFHATEAGTSLSDDEATNGAKLLHDAITRAKGF